MKNPTLTFSRSQKFRVGFIAALICLVIALSYQRWIRPVDDRRVETQQRMNEMNDHLRKARSEIAKIKDRQQHGSEIRNTLRPLHQSLPEDPPIIWFPPRLKSNLARLGISDVNVRLNKTAQEPLLPGFERAHWLVTVPTQDEARRFNDILLAVAQIELQDHFLRLESLSFHFADNGRRGTSGYVNLTSFLPK